MARKRVVADLEALELVAAIERHKHMVPHGDRSGTPLEPFLTDQWYCDAKTLAKDAIAAVEDGRTRFVPRQWENTYFEWMRNIQPWCISRQLWWGHQIPAWYGRTARCSSRRARRRPRPRPPALRARGRAAPRRGRARHLVLLGPVAVLDPGLAGPHARARALLPHRRAGHRLRHHLLLGRPDDDARAAFHGRGAVQGRGHPRPGPRRARRQDVQDQGQRHRPAAADRRLRHRCAAAGAARLDRTGPRRQVRPEPGRGLPQLRDQALERRPLRRDERGAARPGFDPRGCAQPLNRWIVGETQKTAAAVTGRARGLQVQRRGARGSTTSSGTRSATGMSSWPSLCCSARTPRPRRRRVPRRPGR